MKKKNLENVLQQVRDCQICSAHLPSPPQPTLFVRPQTKILIVGQAPGLKAHNSGLSWNDPSGDRLRDWMGIDRLVFYEDLRISCMSMGFCFPGKNQRKADLPPRPECAPFWHHQILPFLPNLQIIILIGSYAQRFYLSLAPSQTLAMTMKKWADYLPRYFVLPHPSWRNNAWLRKHPWVTQEIVPLLREKVAGILQSRD